MSIIIRSSRTRDFYTSPRSGKTYRPRVHEVLLLSLCVTDTPASAVYAFILMNRAGKILGRDIITEFISLAAGAARYAAAVVLAVEILGILRNFLYFSRFSVTRYGDSLYFENGFFSKTRSMCKTGAVNYIDRRQNLASAVLGLGMVFIQCTGYGKARKKEALLVPAAAERSAEACIKMLLPEFCGRTENCGAKAGAHCLRPAAVSFLRYVRTPVALCVPVIIACISVPHFAEVILLILTPPLALLAAVRATAFRRAGIFSEGCEISEKTEGCEKTEARIKSKDVMLTLCYYKGFSIHTVSFRASKISHVKIKQNIMSRNKNIYDVTVYTCGEGGHRHTVRGLDIDREDPQAYITSFPFLQGVFF